MEENLCRICLQTNNEEEMKSIFDKDENTIISNKIKSCCGIKIIKNADGFPTKICSKCNVFLSIAYKLRTICQNSDAYLRRFVVKDFEVEETEEIPIKPEKDVTEKVINCEENVDKLETLAIEIQEEAGETQISSSDWNDDPEKNLDLIQEILQKSRSENSSKKQTFPCEHCGHSFKRKANYLRHQLQKHPEGKINTNEDKYGICPYCGESYAKSSLSLHIRRHTGEKRYKCDMCEKAFVELHDLKRHKRMHTGEKPYVCLTCGMAFTQQSRLTRHKLVHTGERPYKCDRCDSAFTQNNTLKLHIRRHTGERPYVCGVCDQGFISGTLLRKHKKMESHYEDIHKGGLEKTSQSKPTCSKPNHNVKDEIEVTDRD